MRISDWSSDVCSSDLADGGAAGEVDSPLWPRRYSGTSPSVGAIGTKGRGAKGIRTVTLSGQQRQVCGVLGGVGTRVRLSIACQARRPEGMVYRQGRRRTIATREIGRASCQDKVWKDV